MELQNEESEIRNPKQVRSPKSDRQALHDRATTTIRPLALCLLTSTLWFPALAKYSIKWSMIDGGGVDEHRRGSLSERHGWTTGRGRDERWRLRPQRRLLKRPCGGGEP